MFEIFYPFEFVDSVFSIDYEKLYKMGYRGVIFDIDNTLVPHGADSTPEVDALFRQIQGVGLKTLLLSNNDEERILRFLKNIDSLYVCDAEKPKPEGYRKAIEKLGLRKKQIVFIGDQVFTDILGANLCGLDNILVEYIRKKDETKIGKRRTLEKYLLNFYRKNTTCQNRLGDIRKH